MKSVKPPQGGSMKPRHIIKRSAAALALIGLLTQPAQAQLTTVDPAHIALQVQSWASNAASWVKDVEAWNQQFTQWKNQMMSKIGAVLNIKLKPSTDAATRRKEMEGAIQQMLDSKACNKVTDAISQGLCEQENMLKVQRAQRLLKVLEDSDASINKLNGLIAEYKQLVQSASKENSKEGAIQSKEAEIKIVQEDINSKFKEAEADFAVFDRQVEMIHSVRVDVATSLMEGKEPGIFGKLASTALVAGTLTEARDKYKTKSDELRKKTSRY
jgi:hypothetical protein